MEFGSGVVGGLPTLFPTLGPDRRLPVPAWPAPENSHWNIGTAERSLVAIPDVLAYQRFKLGQACSEPFVLRVLGCK